MNYSKPKLTIAALAVLAGSLGVFAGGGPAAAKPLGDEQVKAAEATTIDCGIANLQVHCEMSQADTIAGIRLDPGPRLSDKTLSADQTAADGKAWDKFCEKIYDASPYPGQLHECKMGWVVSDGTWP
jgi:hypothetical protein